MVCMVVTRNGEGSIWSFGSVREARLHPIPQIEDVYASTPDELVDQYGRAGVQFLLSKLEGRDRSVATDAVEQWMRAGADDTLSPEVRRLFWDKCYRISEFPPEDPAEIVRIIVEDRQAVEGRPLWHRSASEFTSSLRKGDSMSTEAAKAQAKEKKAPIPRQPKVSDNARITILTEGGKNPKREGSAAHKRFAAYKNGMTAKQARDAGLTNSDFANDTEKGYIKIEEPAKSAA